MVGDATQTDVMWFVILVVAAVVIFAGAVWFGLSVVAPRIVRALDRADVDEEEPGDRPD